MTNQAEDDFYWRETREVSPIAGMTVHNFKNEVTRALAGDAHVSAAILSLVRDALENKEGENGKEKKQVWDLVWRLAAEQELRQLAELIQIKRVERDQLVADRLDDQRMLEQFDHHRQGMERAEAYRDRHGGYELNGNGELADADAEDMLKAWEKRTGRQLDRSNADEVRAAFREQLRSEEREALRLRREIAHKSDQIGQLDTEIEELEAAEKKARTSLKNGENPDKLSADIQRQLLIRGIGTEEQRQKLAEDQGTSLSQLQAIQDINEDEWGPPIADHFHRAVNFIEPPTAENQLQNANLETVTVISPPQLK